MTTIVGVARQAGIARIVCIMPLLSFSVFFV
jgi:hypothetical protein